MKKGRLIAAVVVGVLAFGMLVFTTVEAALVNKHVDSLQKTVASSQQSSSSSSDKTGKKHHHKSSTSSGQSSGSSSSSSTPSAT